MNTTIFCDGTTVYVRARATVIVAADITTKIFATPELAATELRWYQTVPWACPELLDHDTNRLVIRTGKAADTLTDPPVDEVFDLLVRLQDAGYSHRDAHPANIISTDAGPKLIDWETATIGKGYDLHGPDASGVPIPDIHTECGPMWWASDDPSSITNMWGADALHQHLV